uniref:Uncharacterized protein n=1 Tax=Rhizophagus irregularis (strain DAOM 181602 / DAOM 197198 / MUCL 43194) TaxID=747089 RepID=U9UWE0_RHIID
MTEYDDRETLTNTDDNDEKKLISKVLPKEVLDIIKKTLYFKFESSLYYIFTTKVN